MASHPSFERSAPAKQAGPTQKDNHSNEAMKAAANATKADDGHETSEGAAEHGVEKKPRYGESAAAGPKKSAPPPAAASAIGQQRNKPSKDKDRPKRYA